MRYLSTSVISGVDLGATRNSAAIPTDQLSHCSVVATVTGATSPVGTVKIQASNDPCPPGFEPQFTPTNWVDVASASVAVSDNGTVQIGVTTIAHRFVRVQYTRTSGSGGTITANIFARDEG